MSAAERLENAQAVCAQAGIGTPSAGRLAFSISEIATMLDVSRSTIKRLIDRGELATFKIGRRTRIELTELLEFMERNRTIGKAPSRSSVRSQAVALLDGPHG